MNHDNPHSLARPLAFRNVSEETIPAFAVMAIVGLSTENGLATLKCGQPDGTFRRHYAVNGMQEVAAGRRGSCFRAGDVRVLFDTGTPVAGAGWGPKPGQWTLSQGFPGGTIQGIVDAEHKIARIDCEPINRALVRTTATIGLDTSSTSYRVYGGVSGNEVDAGFTNVPSAHNRSGQVIASGQWAYLVWVHNGWEIQPMRQAALCAVPPCGQGIPARVGSELGANDCCLFTHVDGTLLPVLDSEGAQARATVYNVREVAIPALEYPHERYLLVHADPSGRWICEVPDSVSSSPVESTTTTAGPTLATCEGTCRWLWSSLDNAWHIYSDGCSTPTTTTGGPTTTTTEAPCLCPTTTTTADPEGTSTTTTETTTTSEPTCNCVYPAFCGSETGECTYTSCASGANEPLVDCTTTTTSTTTSTEDPGSTTTCDCNTTTTMDPSTGCTSCSWFCHPIYGWVNTEDGCAGNCACPFPEDACNGDCSQAQTPCVPLPPPPPPPPPPTCGGTCQWLCIPGQGWWLQGNGCTSGIACSCIPPTVPCDSCAAPLTTGCQSPATTTATPTTADPGPCASCYGTTTTAVPTTTSTTTPNPCGSGCKWDGSASGAWALAENNCGTNCHCVPPSYGATADCESAHTECFPELTTTTSVPTTTTTTSSTTTTSTTPEPWYCDGYSDINCDTGVCVQGADNVEFPCGGPYATLEECQAVAPCTTSTTTTSTSTTPEPYYCCGEFGGDCQGTVTCVQGGPCDLGEPSRPNCGGPYDTIEDCEAACTPSTTTSTTTCDPNVACTGDETSCAIVCNGAPGVYVILPLGCSSECECDSGLAEVLFPGVLGSPCNAPSLAGYVGCCNACPGSIDQCGTTTTTAP